MYSPVQINKNRKRNIKISAFKNAVWLTKISQAAFSGCLIETQF